jgi:hypothetical protein
VSSEKAALVREMEAGQVAVLQSLLQRHQKAVVLADSMLEGITPPLLS